MNEAPKSTSRHPLQSLARGAKAFLSVLGSLRRIAVATRLYDELVQFSDRDLAVLGTSRADVAQFVARCVERSMAEPEFVPNVNSVKADARRPVVNAEPIAEPLPHAA